MLRLSLDERMFIKCRGHRELVGTLHAFDQHMNLVLSDVEETHVTLETDAATGAEVEKVSKRTIDMLFVRGDVVIMMCHAK